jgi:hypothetical protein
MMWFLKWFPYALTHGLNVFHTNLFDYPQGVNLADNTSVPLLGLLGWPVTATLGPVAAFNFLIRLAFALSGASMFFVLRRWCSSTIAPFLGGLLYAFGPYTVGQELHLDLAFVPIPPLLVWCADELIRTRRMRPGRLGLLMGAAAGAQLLISPDVLSGCAIMAIGGGAVLALRHRQVLMERLSYIVPATVWALVAFAVISGFLVFELVFGPDHSVGAIIPPSSLQGLHADLLGLVAPTANQAWAPHFIAHLGNEMVANNLSENGTYLGLPLVILLVIIVRRLRDDRVVRALAGLAIGAFAVSLGPSLTVGTLNTHIPLPEVVFAHLPLLDNTIPARYDLYVSLFASMILAIGLERLWLRRQSSTPLSAWWSSHLGRLGADTMRARQARVGLVAGVAVLSLVPSIPFRSEPTPWPASLATSMQRLIPPGSVVLTYPFATPVHPEGMLWEAQAGMNFHLLGGYANIVFNNSGHRWPELLSPPYVQEILGYATSGDRWPAPGPANAADLDALHIFLSRYSVGAIVYWYGGNDPVRAYDYLADGLGKPTSVSGNVVKGQPPEVAIWLPVNGQWPSPHDGP